MVWGAAVMFLGRILGKGIGYFYIIFVARLGAAQYGMLNLGVSIASLLVALSVLGLDGGVLRYSSLYLAKNDRARVKGVLYSVLRICLPLSLILSVLMFLLSEYLAVSIFHDSSLILIYDILPSLKAGVSEG